MAGESSRARYDFVDSVELNELSSDPPNPPQGYSVIWQSNGAGSGADGDIMVKTNADGTTLIGWLAVHKFLNTSV